MEVLEFAGGPLRAREIYLAVRSSLVSRWPGRPSRTVWPKVYAERHRGLSGLGVGGIVWRPTTGPSGFDPHFGVVVAQIELSRFELS